MLLFSALSPKKCIILSHRESFRSITSVDLLTTNYKGCENFVAYFKICSRCNTESLIPDWDLNLGRPKYEIGARTIKHQHSMPVLGYITLHRYKLYDFMEYWNYVVSTVNVIWRWKSGRTVKTARERCDWILWRNCFNRKLCLASNEVRKPEWIKERQGFDWRMSRPISRQCPDSFV